MPAGQSSEGTTSTDAASALSSADRRFIETTARDSMAEVELGKLAAEKAASPEVKVFGQMMVTDHTKACDELKTLASKKGVTLPSDTDSKHDKRVSKLQALSGDEFDRAYMKEMVKDHKKTVSEFKKTAKSSKDDDLKQWAEQKIPTLEQHLQHAQTAADMGSAAGGTSATGATTGTSTSGSGSSSDSMSKDKKKDEEKGKETRAAGRHKVESAAVRRGADRRRRRRAAGHG